MTFTTQIIEDLQLLGIPTNATRQQVEYVVQVLNANQAEKGDMSDQMKEKWDEASKRIIEFFENNSYSRLGKQPHVTTHPADYFEADESYWDHVLREDTTARHFRSFSEIPRTLPLDTMQTFYISGSLTKFSFDEECNPYAILKNFNIDVRHPKLFVDQNASNMHLSSSDFTIVFPVAITLLIEAGYSTYGRGIIFEFKGLPRVILECFMKSSFSCLEPLISGYYLDTPNPIKLSKFQIEEAKKIISQRQGPLDVYFNKKPFDRVIKPGFTDALAEISSLHSLTYNKIPANKMGEMFNCNMLPSVNETLNSPGIAEAKITPKVLPVSVQSSSNKDAFFKSQISTTSKKVDPNVAVERESRDWLCNRGSRA